MTLRPRHFLSSAFVLVIALGIYEATRFIRQSTELAGLRKQAAFLAAQLDRARQQRATTEAYRDTVERDITTLLTTQTEESASIEAQIRTWQTRIDQLKRLVATNPQLCVPQMSLISEEEWFNATTANYPDDRALFAALRGYAEQQLARKISVALATYLD